jgi:hypothetical protein
MSSGAITGGWNFVIAAYTLSALVLIIYGVTLVTRLRIERGRFSGERKTP